MTSSKMINRIARSLSCETRWAGDLNELFYVSEHITIGDQWLQLAGADNHARKVWFLHDASEAFLRDMPTPEKRNMTDYQRREAYMTEEIFGRFGLNVIDLALPEIKNCDRDMAAAEDVTVHFAPCNNYGTPDSALVKIIEERERLDWKGRQRAFLGLYGELWGVS